VDPKGPTTAGHFGHSVCTVRHRRESPHKLPAEFLKSILIAVGSGEIARKHAPQRGGRKYSPKAYSVNLRTLLISLAARTAPAWPEAAEHQGARSIAAIGAVSTECNEGGLGGCPAIWRSATRGSSPSRSCSAAFTGSPDAASKEHVVQSHRAPGTLVHRRNRIR